MSTTGAEGEMARLRVCLAGATGWAGSELARGIGAEENLDLTSAVSRSQAGRALGEALGDPKLGAPVLGTAAEALEVPCDVFVEYTKPGSAKAHVLAVGNFALTVVLMQKFAERTARSGFQAT